MKFENVTPMMMVVVRDWDEMVAEFGLRPSGSVDCPYGFPEALRHRCGQRAMVLGLQQPDAFTLFFPDGLDAVPTTYHPSVFRPLAWDEYGDGPTQDVPAPGLTVIKGGKA